MIENSSKVKRLLNTAKGQIDGVGKMLDEGRNVVDVANQVLAIQAVLKSINKELLSATLCNDILGKDCQPSAEQIARVKDVLNKVL